jgi:Ca-activated chloride channel family protein
MFRFSNPEYLYLLAAVPLFVLLLIVVRRRQRLRLKRFGNPMLLHQLMPDLSRKRPVLKAILQVAILTVCIFMIAGPQFGSKKEKAVRKGAEIMIALDVSNSMMAEDITPSRLEKSKQLISRLVDKLSNDKVGLVIFAGEAFTQLPITSDYVSAKLFLNTLSPDLIQTQGTAIGAAIDLCNRSFGPKGEAERAIIVITDGENFEDNATESAKLAAEQGIQTHVVGMGDLQGAPIPLGNGRDFRKDREGNVVITKLNEQMCREIAAAGEGVYVRSDNANAALRVLTKELDTLTKADVEGAVYSEYDEQFQALAWIMLVLLVIDVFIEERRSRLFRSIKLF